jgi:hypothetical protein
MAFPYKDPCISRCDAAADVQVYNMRHLMQQRVLGGLQDGDWFPSEFADDASTGQVGCGLAAWGDRWGGVVRRAAWYSEQHKVYIQL